MIRARLFLVCVALALLVLAPVTLLAEETAQPTVTFEAVELAPGLHVLIAQGGFGGGNVGLLSGDDGVVLIDDSYPPFTATLLEAVEKTAGAPVDFVVNTHVHGDHLGGNAALGASGTTIVAHDNVRSRLVAEGIPTGGEENLPAPPEALPVLTFDDSVTFHLNGQESYVFHVENAHTDGDAVIHFRGADVIHAGDVFFHTLFPFIDLDSGGSLDGYIAAQETILQHAGPDTQIVPGHGPMATKADLEASVAMLKDVRERIGAMVEAGKTVDEVIAAEPLTAYASMDWQFITTERMIRQVHRALSGE